MVFEEIRIMRGPNMWSQNHYKLLAVKFDPKQYADVTDANHQKINDFFLKEYN